MFLGALLDAGLSRRHLTEQLAGLGLEHRLRISNVHRGALAARYLEVLVPGVGPSKKRSPRTHAHRHAHEHSHSAGHTHAHASGRRYAETRRLLERAELDGPVRERAQAIFAALAEAEARVHGISVDEVHFHEVGAVDAIVDITGAAIALALLDVRAVTASPVALGHGSVETDHGRLPLPAPATLELLRGVPTVPAHVEWETVTPTGAAILRTIVDDYRSLPAMTVEAIGHGAGNDRPGPMPNVMRAILGRGPGAGMDRIVCLETNLDDVVPEHFDHWMERLLAAGALDVSIQHVQTKKNRPGFLLRVLSQPADRAGLASLLLAETGSLGLRVFECDRLVLERHSRRIETPYGRISVKFVTGEDGRVDVSAEYDDCKRAAQRSQVPLRDVVRAAESAARTAEDAARIAGGAARTAGSTASPKRRKRS